jgi:hypothetical protein
MNEIGKAHHSLTSHMKMYKIVQHHLLLYVDGLPALIIHTSRCY